MEKKMLCVTNVELDDPGGRSHALRSRLKFLDKHDWEVEFFVLKHYHESISKLWRFRNRVVRDIRFVWSMNNPFTLHLPPLFLKKIGINFIWVAEFRDPIYLNPDPKKLKSIYKVVDMEVIKRADCLVVPKGMQADLIDYSKEYGINLDKFFSLPFAGINDEKCSDISYSSTPPFTITYAGSFYKGWIEPLTFLDGFRRFVNESNLTPENVQVKFFGDWREEYWAKVKEFGLERYVRVMGWVRRPELGVHLRRSHLFLHIAGSSASNRKNVSYKFWDYLCHAKPILALCGGDFTIKDIILKNNFGYVADYDDPKDIAQKLSQAYSDFESEKANKIIRKLIRNRKKFSRYHHDDTFAQICDAVYMASKVI